MEWLLLLAQGVEDPDWQGLGVAAINALIPILTMVFIWIGRRAVQDLPKATIPIIAVVLGTGLDFLMAYMSGGQFTPLVGAVLGACATWLHELIKELGKAIEGRRG